MNVLMLGVGAGSWDIRGRQLGGALGARVTQSPTRADFVWADVVVLVKRAISFFGEQARQSGKPVVWDALDFWSQPSQNSLSMIEAVAAARQMAGSGVSVLGATQAMANALGGTYLSHHAWPGMTPSPARARVQTVAYQGAEPYLGRWAGWVSTACASRGWRFIVNPADLAEADILVAFRDGPWDGAICRAWKSGVKAVNALVAGRPLISQASAGVREVQPMGSIVETPEALEVALDHWSSLELRSVAVDVSRSRAQAYSVDSVAIDYRRILEGVACPV